MLVTARGKTSVTATSLTSGPPPAPPAARFGLAALYRPSVVCPDAAMANTRDSSSCAIDAGANIVRAAMAACIAPHSCLPPRLPSPPAVGDVTSPSPRSAAVLLRGRGMPPWSAAERLTVGTDRPAEPKSAPSESSSPRKYVSITPLPLTLMPPRASSSKRPRRCTSVVLEHCMRPGRQVDSMREAVLTVSPNSLYRGFLMPTMPATIGPLFSPTRICSSRPRLPTCSLMRRRMPGMASIMALAMRAALTACSAEGSGQPPTTMYTSPTVSTLYTSNLAMSSSKAE
mmetsp:Transcript_24965/g.86980  ORF Transcript_24965/g.86980 Transcript_24965/m.86980 type:complete len:286 (-) Transcript_24965:1338-2195(-)